MFRKTIIGLCAILFLILPLKVFSQTYWCDFWGTAKVRGVNVSPGDVIDVYDSGGEHLGQATIPQSGSYYITVPGDDPGTPEDEGAPQDDPLSFTINGESAEVTSGEGSNKFDHRASKECNIEVPDVPPEADPGGPYSGYEGNTVQFNGSGSVGAATYTWDWGDGTPGGTGVAPTHTYADDGTYTVTLTVENGSSQQDTETTTANISNVSPTVQAGNNQTINEGQSISLDPATFEDPAFGNDSYTATINWGDGNVDPGTVTPPSSPGEVSGSHTYENNGVFTVTVTVNDEDGGSGNDTFTVTVNNIAPTVEAGNNQTVNEGDQVNFSGSATDPGVNDVLTYTWDFGDGNFGNGQNVSHQYGDNNTYNVVLTVNDGDDDGTDNLSVTVNNVAPTAHANGDYVGVTNQPLNFSGSVTDPGFNDTHTYEWDLDNNGSFETAGQNPSKTWTTAGDYTVQLRVTDDDGASDTDVANVRINEGVTITFLTSPVTNGQIYVDGQPYSTPISLILIPGHTHTIEAPAIQWPGAGYQYAFENWSDGGAREHMITIPSSDRTYTASYQQQYYLQIDTDGRDGNPVGEGWYAAGTRINISVDENVIDGAGTSRSTFSRWVGTGPGSYTGTEREAIVTMGNQAIVQRVEWNDEYKLDIQTPFGTAVGEGWYEPGADVAIRVDTLVQTGPSTRFTFQSWQGEGTGAYTGTDNPADVTVNSPILQTAIWKTEYYVSVVSEYGTPIGEGWYETGSNATVSIDTVIGGGPGTRIRFKRWEGIGIGAFNGPDPEFIIEINGPVTQTAQWGVEHLLTVTSAHGTPVGGGWYEEGALAAFSVDSVINNAVGDRHFFTGWTGTGTGSYTGANPEANVIIQGPVQEFANWEHQYFVDLSVDPQGSGDILPLGVPGGWAEADATLELSAVGNANNGFGFSHWTGDANGTDNPLQLFLDGPKNIIGHFVQGRVIVQSDPPGLNVKVDNVIYVSPVVFNWAAGESHTLDVVTPQGDNVQSRFSFREWSDGQPQLHNIVVQNTQVTYTAFFNAEYYLQVNSDYGSPTGEGWYTQGSQTTVSVDSVVNETSMVRRIFSGWKGSGNGSVTSPMRQIQVTVNGPIVEEAEWAPQFKLDVQTFPPFVPSANLLIQPPGPWFDPGAGVLLTASVTDTTARFEEWTGDVNSEDNPIAVTMDGPMNIVAQFFTYNQPPEIQAIPDLSIIEDEELWLPYIWFHQYVSDPNDPMDWLTWEYRIDDHFTIVDDPAKEEIRITPDANWSGVEDFIIRVTDPVGMSAVDTVRILVVSVPDPPGPFSLLEPENEIILNTWPMPLFFSWETSANYDTGDEISYSLYISPNPDLVGEGSKKFQSISGTMLGVVPQPDGVYYWAVRAEDKQGYQTWSDTIYTISAETPVEDDQPVIPKSYKLDQNFPNPFNPETTIRFTLPKRSHVTLSVFDMRGGFVCNLLQEEIAAGVHNVKWNAYNQHGLRVSSGIYFIRIQADDFIQQRKMILIR